MKSITELKELRKISLKVFMFKRNDMPIKLTKIEQNILAEGKKTLSDMDREQLLSSLGVKNHITVSNEVKNCCLKALFCGAECSKIDSPDKRYTVKRPDAGDIIESIIENNYSYLQLLKSIRKVITVDEPVNYNDKI